MSSITGVRPMENTSEAIPGASAAPSLRAVLLSLHRSSNHILGWAEIVSAVPVEQITCMSNDEPIDFNKVMRDVGLAKKQLGKMHSVMEAVQEKLLHAANPSGHG